MPLHERNPAFASKLSQMRLAIAPIVHVQNGLPAPDYPKTMLALFCLTENQLDAMAQYYSQSTPSLFTYQYPQTMDWSRDILSNNSELPDNCKLNDAERLRVKMRMFARFIGITGAETPTWEYERQVEILSNKIRRGIAEEETSLRKFHWGGSGYVP